MKPRTEPEPAATGTPRVVSEGFRIRIYRYCACTKPSIRPKRPVRERTHRSCILEIIWSFQSAIVDGVVVVIAVLRNVCVWFSSKGEWLPFGGALFFALRVDAQTRLNLKFPSPKDPVKMWDLFFRPVERSENRTNGSAKDFDLAGGTLRRKKRKKLACWKFSTPFFSSRIKHLRKQPRAGFWAPVAWILLFFSWRLNEGKTPPNRQKQTRPPASSAREVHFPAKLCKDDSCGWFFAGFAWKTTKLRQRFIGLFRKTSASFFYSDIFFRHFTLPCVMQGNYNSFFGVKKRPTIDPFFKYKRLGVEKSQKIRQKSITFIDQVRKERRLLN